MSGRLIESLATTPALAALFSDESVLSAMLEFEIALARAEARHGLIPPEAANAVAAAVPGNFAISVLAEAAFRAGTPAIPLVKMLTDEVRKADADAARFVHWGATSQDVADTAMALLLRRAEPILIADLLRCSVELCFSRRLPSHSDSKPLDGWLRFAAAGGVCRKHFEWRRCCSLGEPAVRWHRSATAEFQWPKL